MFASAHAASSQGAGKPSSVEAPRYTQRGDVAAWIADTSFQLAMPVERIEAVLSQARYSPEAARFILPTSPTVQRSWRAYRSRFVEPVRLNEGQRFWDTHRIALARAEAKWGVPAEVIVAIIGIETLYGRQQGNFRALDVLATLGFDWPTEAPRDRSAFFRDQLAELLALAREQNIEPQSFKSSYAGAIGLPQFMPGSIRAFAVDFDNDGHVDLRNTPTDAIGSVANFLVQHGWVRDMPVWFSARLTGESAQIEPLIAHDLIASYEDANLREAGMSCAVDRNYNGPLGVVDLVTPDEPTAYRCATPNFFAITQYNRSFFYAGAVAELALALRAERRAP
ncbi:MAG TPA: lytic murein transglycosylase B [Burkholderiaceae bacterium]|nr:lytic murein transglycosylase B [Burkholderiaceae bacterium]